MVTAAAGNWVNGRLTAGTPALSPKPRFGSNGGAVGSCARAPIEDEASATMGASSVAESTYAMAARENEQERNEGETLPSQKLTRAIKPRAEAR